MTTIMRSIVLVGGYCSGKTTLAQVLEQDYGYARLGLADRLKSVAADVYNGGEPIDKAGTYYVTNAQTGERECLSGRQIFQRLGESVKALDRDFWIKWVLCDTRRKFGPFVIDDCRFPYEAQAFRCLQWQIVKLDVPALIRNERYKLAYGRYPNDVEMIHDSETLVDSIKCDYTLDGTVDRFALASSVVKLTHWKDY